MGVLDIVDIDALAVYRGGDLSTTIGAAAAPTACAPTPLPSAREVDYWRSVARPVVVVEIVGIAIGGVVGPFVSRGRRKGRWEDGIGRRKRDWGGH